jgi:hypothetical protein
MALVAVVFVIGAVVSFLTDSRFVQGVALASSVAAALLIFRTGASRSN